VPKTCYVIMSPVSCGNRVLAAVMVRSGCTGDASVGGDLITLPSGARVHALPDGDCDAVLLRTVGADAPSLIDIPGDLLALKVRGYRVVALVSVREPFAAASSLLQRNVVDSLEAGVAYTRESYRIIFGYLPYADDWRLVPHESLYLEGGIPALLATLGRSPGGGDLVVDNAPQEIRNVNAKHYAELLQPR